MDKSLDKLKGSSVQVLESNYYPDTVENACVVMTFTGGTKLRAEDWRIIKEGKVCFSSFDHQQKYGLPAPINALKLLEKELQNKSVIKAQLDKETGDLNFEFTENIKFQVFNFTGYEVWEMKFPDGAVEYSNQNKLFSC